uniref:helix-turn-helix domain-containing protein n=1 Tax=Allosaccharopolyspora coralli TaxID=2665642 RepID=UPI001C9E9880|nr:helix-turn-helix domain-containing protein [Allosaccharopolyspora coralli]
MGQRTMLTGGDREEISRGIAEGVDQAVIAERIERNPSVVSREIRRHGGRAHYRAQVAVRQATSARARPKIRKLDTDPVLREVVTTKLREGCSPDQVAGRLRHERPGQQAWQVSHEAIYTWIYALPTGELARQGIWLRSGRSQRRSRGRARSSGARIVGMRSIETPGRGRRPQGARTLGRGSRGGQGRQNRHGHPGRAYVALHLLCGAARRQA